MAEYNDLCFISSGLILPTYVQGIYIHQNQLIDMRKLLMIHLVDQLLDVRNSYQDKCASRNKVIMHEKINGIEPRRHILDCGYSLYLNTIFGVINKQMNPLVVKYTEVATIRKS